MDDSGKITNAPLLRAPGPYADRTGPLMNLVKRAMDLQAGETTPEATAPPSTATSSLAWNATGCAWST